MLIATMKIAHADWFFLKFHERDDTVEHGRPPQFFDDGLPKDARVKPSEIALRSATGAIVDSLPNADDLYVWLSEHARAQFQIPVGFPADAQVPVAFGIFFRDKDDLLHFADQKLYQM